MKINPGDIISHAQMNVVEGYSLQRGMNYQINGGVSVFLMSIREGAPYDDKIEDGGSILIYEGHDAQKGWERNPKSADQPMHSPSGKLTENGKFFEAAADFKKGLREAELIKVYQKIKKGIWTYNGVFELLDAHVKKSSGRKVFKFRLKITDQTVSSKKRKLKEVKDIEHNRIIPTSIKLEVWKRDKGKCVMCGSTNNLHFDHDLPYSKGGTSIKVENIQLLCARHNLQKHNKIL